MMQLIHEVVRFFIQEFSSLELQLVRGMGEDGRKYH